MKRILIQIGVGLLLVIVGAAAGRYFAPVKVKTEVKVEYRDRIVEKEVVKVQTVYVQAKAEQKRVVTVKKPDGTQVRIEDTNIRVETASQTNEDRARSVEAERTATQVSRQETTYQRPANTLTLMGGTGFDLKPSYGVMYTRQLLGPVQLGVWYMRSDYHRAGAAI